jgi:hypothetical protein
MNDSSPELTWQQLLAACADGELDAAARRRAEEWLRRHPESATHFTDQRALSPRNERLWTAVAPPTPSDARWNDVRSGIERRLDPNVEPRRRPRANRWLKRGLLLATLAFAGATAAAVVVAAFPPHRAIQPLTPDAEHPGLFDDGDEVFLVIRPDDVDIVSIRHADFQHIVVGQSPLNEPLVPIEPGDVTKVEVHPDSEGRKPVIRMDGAEVWGILPPQ